ncbi:MAG: JAB domain-containing protein [Spirochaetaceae bacterium]
MTSTLVAHNHPSGNIEPSAEDRETTERLRQAGETLGVRLLDHLIFAAGRETGSEPYYSFLEKGVL